MYMLLSYFNKIFYSKKECMDHINYKCNIINPDYFIYTIQILEETTKYLLSVYMASKER